MPLLALPVATINAFFLLDKAGDEFWFCHAILVLVGVLIIMLFGTEQESRCFFADKSNRILRVLELCASAGFRLLWCFTGRSLSTWSFSGASLAMV